MLTTGNYAETYEESFLSMPEKTEQVGAKQGAPFVIAERAKEYIQTHYPEKFSLDQMATALFVNKIYLSKCFKQATGGTLLKYHHKIRCAKACELLKTTDLSVEIISDRVGYATASHFARTFRGIYHCSPIEYRKK